MLPEVILLAKAEDPIRRDPDILIPDLPGLIVLQVYRRIEPVRVKSHHLCQELPGPGDGLFLKVISKGKIPQHLKEGPVPGCLSYILDIPRTDTLLTGGHTLAWRDLLSGKIRFQRRHTGIDQEQALVIMGHQGKTLHGQMSLALEELQEHSS